MQRYKPVPHRFLTVSVVVMGGGQVPNGFWIQSLHMFAASVPIRRGAITCFDLFIAEIYPAKGVLDSTLWYTASKSGTQLARIIAAEIQSQLGSAWAAKVMQINRTPGSCLEFEEYSHWLANLP